MSHLTYLVKSGFSLPVRFVEKDMPMYVPVDMWKTYQLYLSQEHIFVVTNKPHEWKVQGYLDFEGLMYPSLDDIFSNLTKHGSKIYRYFIGIHHFGNGIITEL